MALERSLPAGCTYQPCDVVARDERTLVCDFNAGEFPENVDCDIVFALGVLEYLADIPAFLAKLRALGKPAVLTYSVTDRDGPRDRRALGWANDHTQAEILSLLDMAGMPGFLGMFLENGQILVRAEPKPLPSTVGGGIPPGEVLGRLAARMVPAYAQILDIGGQASLLTPFSPTGCSFVPSSDVPDATTADIVLMLEAHLRDPDYMIDTARLLGKPLICTWVMGGTDSSNLSSTKLAMEAAGFLLQCLEQATPSLSLLKWVPFRASDQSIEGSDLKRVLVMSHLNSTNFGDRLGYHILNGLLPANAEVTYGTFEPWSVPDRKYDLLIIGIGTSLLVKDAANPEFLELLDRVPQAIGIFGTQFRYQFRHPAGARALNNILSKVTTWWARYEEDVLAFGKGRPNVRHLGDWLISAFPLTVPSIDKSLTFPFVMPGNEISLDRTIQTIQAYRGVESARLHPLLCALTSAEKVAFHEQTNERESYQESGKFRSLLFDVFGRAFDAGEAFDVDHRAVRRYKQMVEANLLELRAELHRLLG